LRGVTQAREIAREVVMEHVAFAGSVSISLALAGATLRLERRYSLLARRDPERALAVFGHAMNPIMWRALSECWLRDSVVAAAIHFAFILLWLWRCEERWLTFPEPDERPRYRLPIALAAFASLVAGAAAWRGCAAGAMVANFAFAASWTAVAAFSHKLETKMPREHAERELVWVIWACVFAPAVAAPFVASPLISLAVSVAQTIVAARLLGHHARRAIGRDEEGSGRVYETVYRLGGEIRNGVEALYTPIRAGFLEHCRQVDPESVVNYGVAEDYRHGAVLGGDPATTVFDAARKLDRAYWKSYVSFRAEPPTRIVRRLDDSASESDDDEE
jgi:hypothetical protein